MLKKDTDFIHDRNTTFRKYVREVVFGMQDGMVSTLGAITGIAVGSENHFVVVLAGLVVIAVESISMAMGSYTSTLSEKHITERMLSEEKSEIHDFPDTEKKELETMFVQDGWPKEMAGNMAKVASQDKDLMLQEMAYRELKISSDNSSRPIINGLFMFGSYIIGGIIPLSPYFFASIQVSMPVSIGVTLVGLFVLGAYIAWYARAGWFRGGVRIFLLGAAALLAGYLVGELTPVWIG